MAEGVLTILRSLKSTDESSNNILDRLCEFEVFSNNNVQLEKFRILYYLVSLI